MENSRGNVYDKSSVETMDIVDDKGDPYAIKQLVNLHTYLEKNASPSIIEDNQINGLKDVLIRTVQARPSRAAAFKACVEESTARYWRNKYQKDPDNTFS
ncbi:hypothetical protein G6F56_005084 [Rhizopus delemar]|nr:hypothetical protein G6F56_005084 [Rhizopus delemar]